MSKKLTEVRVIASCGHPVWVAVRDSSDQHNADRIAQVRAWICQDCRENATRRSRLPGRIEKLRAAALSAPPNPDMPRGRIEIAPIPDGWRATLTTGATGTAPSPTGAILAAFAAELESELQEGERCVDTSADSVTDHCERSR